MLKEERHIKGFGHGEKYNNYIELKVILKENKYHFYYRYQSNDLWELFDTANSNLLLWRRLYRDTHWSIRH